MSAFVIEGGNRLEGEVKIHGAKNSVLPILAASLLCKTPCVIRNCPNISDTRLAIKILRHLGCDICFDNNEVRIDTKYACGNEIPDDLMRKMRSSVIFLGAIIARCKRATISYPGGCELGPRPIDLHLKALADLGVLIEEEYGNIYCSIKDNLKGAQINLPFPSVGATENILIASCVSCGTTKVFNAAREPEIVDLANFLNCCGADIIGAGESTIVINGVKELKGCDYSIIPDRIEASTYMSAAAITGGRVTLRNIIPEHISPTFNAFLESGCEINQGEDFLEIIAPKRLNRISQTKTLVYPGFPTDSQAPLMAMTTLAKGTSVFIETIFESRYKHVDQLRRMGANIKIEQRVAIVEGAHKLYGTTVTATDLRGGAALIVAGLSAYGKTKVYDAFHIDRGYEDIEYNLSKIGANIKRI